LQERSVKGVEEEGFTDALAAKGAGYGKAAKQGGGDHRVAWEALRESIGKLHEVDAELRECVIACDGWRLDERDVDYCGVLLHILRGLTLQIGVESGNATGEDGTVVAFFVEQFDFHA
jgi:hypothetical protein